MANRLFEAIARRGYLPPGTEAAGIDGPTTSAKPVVLNVATVSLTKEKHAGRTLVLDKADGVAATLPAATGSGSTYSFFVKTTSSGGTYVIQVANTADSMLGNVQAIQDDASALGGWKAAADDDTVTLNGTTKGGYIGDWIEVQDVAVNLFRVNGLLTQTGAEATPFSAAV